MSSMPTVRATDGMLREMRTQADPARPTPRKIDFASVFARGSQTALVAGANILGPASPAGTGLVASLAGAGGAAQAAASSAATGTAAGGSVGGAGAFGGGAESQLLDKQEAMRQQDRVFNLQYLDLQRKVQEDQRQFELLSNLMKSKHETVKTAINNIR